jgi:hypothetical protein
MSDKKYELTKKDFEKAIKALQEANIGKPYFYLTPDGTFAFTGG